MQRGPVRPILSAVLVALVLVAGCGGGSDDAATEEGAAGTSETGADTGDGADGGEGEGAVEEVTLSAEQVAVLDPIDLTAVAAGDDALFAVTATEASSGLVRIGTDGTVTELSTVSAETTLATIFATGAGVFAAVRDATEVCGYAQVDQDTGALGTTIALPTEEEFCYPPPPTLVDDSIVAAVVDDTMVLVDTAGGTVEEVAVDLPASTDSLRYSHSVAVTDDALYVTSNGYDPTGTGPTEQASTATRIARESLEQTAQGELPGGLVVLPTGLVSREWTDANGDEESQPEEIATFTVDPETLEVEATDEELDRSCPTGELARLPQEAGVWHTTRRTPEAPSEVLLVAPGTCDVLGSVELAPIDGETDESLIAVQDNPIGDDLFVLRQLFDSDPDAPPAPVTLDRVSVD